MCINECYGCLAVINIYPHPLGLSLYVNIEQYNYVPFMTEASGLRVVIHDINEMPFPSDSGFSVAPNTLTRVSVRRVSNVFVTSQVIGKNKPMRYI